jgi:Predicted transcriptional regulator
MSKNLGERIRDERERRKWAQSELARRSNLSGEYISKIELGKATNVGIETIEAIAGAFEMHPANLLYGNDLLKYAAEKRLKGRKDGRPTEAVEAPDFEPFDIPVVGLAKAGKEGFFDDAGFPVGEGFRKVHRPDFVKDPNAYGLIIDGDSMSPMIEKGWMVVVSPTETVINGDLAVARLSTGEVMLKKVQIQSELIVLSSVNPTYAPVAVRKKDLEFLHRVVMIKPK